jgi:hypothetical protein
MRDSKKAGSTAPIPALGSRRLPHQMFNQLTAATKSVPVQSVVHPATFSSVVHQPGVLEHLQVEGKAGLGGIQCIGEVANTSLTPAKPPEDLEAGFIRQRMKDLGGKGSFRSSARSHDSNISITVDISRGACTLLWIPLNSFSFD